MLEKYIKVYPSFDEIKEDIELLDSVLDFARELSYTIKE